ncbi:MAG TPA: hypothetical protein VFF27_00855 [Bacteroidia bacterium]|jgi:hypothetical protein|nr:hypothetical protein [Bacteroidia bacterium]
MEQTYSTILFFSIFILAISLLLISFGRQIVKDAHTTEHHPSTVTSKQVSHYFMARGYIVCSLAPIKDTGKWLGFLIKNGEYIIATAFTEGQTIKGHDDVLA